MLPTNCLNCNATISGKFCSNCGQKTDIHRLSFKHFIMHDLLHGTFHIERKMWFTAKQAMLRPGRAALDYIEGKRVNYYNVFYFVLLLVALHAVLFHYYEVLLEKLHYENPEEEFPDNVNASLDFLSRYSKIILLCFVPVIALNSLLLFKKARLNFIEHCVIAGNHLLGLLIFSLISVLISFLGLFSFFEPFSNFVAYITPVFLVVYIVVGYFRTFHTYYSTKQNTFRTIALILLLLIEILILLTIVMLTQK